MPRKLPLESFGPELTAALLEGAKREYSIALPYGAAVKFRHRIYQLRNAMREAKHHEYPAVARTKLTIAWDRDVVTQRNSRGYTWPRDRLTPCLVTISPNDSEFAPALRKAGVTVRDLDIDPLGTPQASPLSDYAPKDTRDDDQ